MRRLAARIVVLVAGVALVTAVLAAGVLVRALRQVNSDQAAAVLLADADAAADRVAAGGTAADLRTVVRLQRRGYRAQVVRTDPPPARLPVPFGAADLTAAPGDRVTTRAAAGRRWLLVARPAGASQVLLVARRVDDTGRLTPAQRNRVLLGALAGLAGGALAGFLLARGVSRPLAGLAVAARRMTTGERGVPLPTGGTREVDDVRGALAALDAALAGSEERQRRFLMSVSHELRTPLTAVTGYAEMLAEPDLPPEQAVAAARVVLAESQRLQRRVADLLALARLDADDFRLTVETVDVVAVLVAARDAAAPRAAAAGVQLRLEVPPALPARADGEALRQCVDALLDNAVRVLPAGAPLVLAAAGTTVDSGRPAVAVSVRDGGPGLAEEDLAVAFDRARLAERYRGSRPVGTGLGLALVGELARRMGGVAVASHAPEGGAAFTVVLPAA